MKLWEVHVSEPCWRGGDYNGSWSTSFITHQFSSLEKATTFAAKEKASTQQVIMGERKIYGPSPKEIT